jgi:acetoacetyl-CoA synthetase
MLGVPTEPVHKGEIQKRGLGMAVEAWDDDGRPVVDEKGELVCTRPFPSMPIRFWDDKGGKKYKAAYFERFPGVWHHGDWITITKRGGVVVHGRSDATLNPGGVRIGTSEIYAPVEAMPQITDALAVGHVVGDDTEIVLFVVLADGVTLDAALEDRIRKAIKSANTPRHVPAKILACPAIPRTASGKKVEVAVTRVLHGEDVPNRDAIANPAALDWFRNVKL